MWNCKSSSWHSSMSPLSQFMTEAIIQRTDPNEIISNKNRSSNGYTQVKEIIKLCDLTLKRPRTVRALQMHIQEAKSYHVSQNIINDLIVDKYFSDLKQFILDYDFRILYEKKNYADLPAVINLRHKMVLFEIQLEKFYYKSIEIEFEKIDFSNNSQFERKADLIRKLIDVLISYLAFHGYAISSFSEIAKKWVRRKRNVKIKTVFRRFDLTIRSYVFLINMKEEKAGVKDFIKLVKTKYGNKTESVFGRDVTNEAIDSDKINSKDILIRYFADALDPQMQMLNSFDDI